MSTGGLPQHASRERQLAELERDPTSHHVGARRLRRPIGLRQRIGDVLGARRLGDGRVHQQIRLDLHEPSEWPPGPAIMGAEQIICQARRVAGTNDVAGGKTGARGQQRRVGDIGDVAPRFDRGERSVGFAASFVDEVRREQNRRPIGARDCQLLNVPELCEPLLGVPQRRERSRDVPLEGEQVAEVLLRDRSEVRMPDGIAGPDRLAQVLGAFVDASTLGTQQAEVGVGARRSRLVT